MSGISRTCLRLAACAALRNATIAGQNVFDSRIEAVDPAESGQAVPVIAVYTEQDEGDALSESNGGPPFVSVVELALEIAMQAKFSVDGSYVIAAPETDDQLEATIDLIETQAELALFRAMASLSALFRIVAKRVKSKNSIRFTDPKGSGKLAIRYVIFKIEIDDREIPITDPTQTGLNRLPYPFNKIAAGWPTDCPEYEKAVALAAALAGTAPPSFKGVVATLPTPPTYPDPEQPNPPRVEDWELPQ